MAPAIDNASALTNGTPLPNVLNSYFLTLYKCPGRHFVLAAMLT